MDIAHLSQWIGREEEQADDLTPALVRRFRATLGLPGNAPEDAPVDAPEDTPEDTPAGAAPVAPQLIHLCLGLPATTDTGPDGHPARGGFLPPVPLPRRMWAGGRFAFHAPLRVGEPVLRRSRIADVQARQGRSGPLCFVAVDHQILQSGRLAVSERHDIVYRGLSPAAPPAAPPDSPAPAGEHQRRVTPTPTLLFRFSAITFNGHRIHYDAPYATGVEGYPGLVVHGPLQAALLCHFAAGLQGAPLRRFAFRSRAALFDTGDFTLNARRTDRGLSLWTATPGGPVAMEAEAE